MVRVMHPDIPAGALGARVMAFLDALARFTDEPGRITRLYLSPAHRAAADFVAGRMREAGLSVHEDALGSVIGRWQAGAPEGTPALLIGSHIDSVVDAGAYDGTLGVATAIVAVEELVSRGIALPFPVEIVAFGDEENVRFPTSLSTSNALAGRYDEAWLAGTDADGTTLAEALRRFAPTASAEAGDIAALRRSADDVRGYLEIHIEQGPQLEAAAVPLGIVSAIAGATRARCTVTGEAGHAGTVPMAMRRDALAGAAEMILAVEAIARAEGDVVATVGGAKPMPGAINVIPGEVAFTLDARSGDDGTRRRVVDAIRARCERIAAARGLAFAFAPVSEAPATPMDQALQAAFAGAARDLGLAPPTMMSGAGHDAAAMATLCPSGMLFVRCRGGVSHNPAESIAAEDADAAARVLAATVMRLAGA